jgi:hypothetical protein
MSNERKETIADIVSEMREGVVADGWMEQTLREFADRIEKAENQSVTNCNRLGNSAKMREALVKADAAFRLISKSAWFIDANFSETKKLMDAGNSIEVALAAPTRNCDRPECATTKEAQEVWSQEDGGKTAYYEWLLATSTKGEENENS